jgi:hypothetical protein
LIAKKPCGAEHLLGAQTKEETFLFRGGSFFSGIDVNRREMPLKPCLIDIGIDGKGF